MLESNLYAFPHLPFSCCGAKKEFISEGKFVFFSEVTEKTTVNKKR